MFYMKIYLNIKCFKINSVTSVSHQESWQKERKKKLRKYIERWCDTLHKMITTGQLIATINYTELLKKENVFSSSVLVFQLLCCWKLNS